MRKGMGRLVWRGARADNATAHGYSGNVDRGQAQDCLPSTRPRQELFSRLSGVCRWPNDPEGFRATSLRRVARSTDVERVRVVAKVR